MLASNNNDECALSVPEPMTRAPRMLTTEKRPSTALYLGKDIGCDAVVAVVSRDTGGVMLSEAQRLSHFPASSFVSLSWHNNIGIGVFDRPEKGDPWKETNENVQISGSQSQPTVSWSAREGRGGMMCFTVSAAQALFNIDVTTIQDRSVCARQLLGDTWFSMLDQLVASPDDATMLETIKRHIVPRWSRRNHALSPVQSLRYAGSRWVDGLVSQAKLWQSARSIRQVERRVKAMSGRSLREWQLLVSTEKIFFEVAQDDQNALHSLDWAALALEAGFSDQAHLCRAVKRITGFPPAEFARRFVEDESFWIYRLWT